MMTMMNFRHINKYTNGGGGREIINPVEPQMHFLLEQSTLGREREGINTRVQCTQRRIQQLLQFFFLITKKK